MAKIIDHNVIYPCGCELLKRVDPSTGETISSERIQCNEFTAQEWLRGKRCDLNKIHEG